VAAFRKLRLLRRPSLLQKVHEKVAECLRRAAAAEARVQATADAKAKAEYEQISDTWRSLAASYEFQASLGQFVKHGAPSPANAAPTFSFGERGQRVGIKKLALFVQIVGVLSEWVSNGEENPADELLARPEYDPARLEELQGAAFNLLGKSEGQAQELSKAILKAAERPRSGSQAPLDRDVMRLFVEILDRVYAL
jgi:hypothetical protein